MDPSCLHQESAFWIYGALIAGLALGAAAILLAFARSRVTAWVAIGALFAAGALVSAGDRVAAGSLPSGGEISPEVREFARAQKIELDGREAVDRNEREWRATAHAECRAFTMPVAGAPILLAVAAFVIRRRRARATS